VFSHYYLFVILWHSFGLNPSFNIKIYWQSVFPICRIEVRHWLLLTSHLNLRTKLHIRRTHYFVVNVRKHWKVISDAEFAERGWKVGKILKGRYECGVEHLLNSSSCEIRSHQQQKKSKDHEKDQRETPSLLIAHSLPGLLSATTTDYDLAEYALYIVFSVLYVLEFGIIYLCNPCWTLPSTLPGWIGKAKAQHSLHKSIFPSIWEKACERRDKCHKEAIIQFLGWLILNKNQLNI
jgi:hypothetical protein